MCHSSTPLISTALYCLNISSSAQDNRNKNEKHKENTSILPPQLQFSLYHVTTFLPCYCLATRWRSLLQDWKHCLLLSLREFPCQGIKSLHIAIVPSLKCQLFCFNLFLWKGGISKENICIKKKKNKTNTQSGERPLISFTVRLLLQVWCVVRKKLPSYLYENTS